MCRIFFSALFFALARAAFAQLIPEPVLATLLKERFLSRAYFESDVLLELSPASPELQKTIELVRKELKPGVIVESLSVYDKNIQNGAAVKNPRWNAQEKTALFNGVISLSTLAGIRYYSPSRKQTRLFYEDSYVIDSPKKPDKKQDPVYGVSSVPSSLLIYAKQKDLTFGENIYQYNYNVYDGAIIFVQTNLTKMNYGIIPVLGEKKLRTIIAVIDAGNYLLLYMVSMADAVAFPGMKNRVSLSFSSRSEAVIKWFTGKADTVYQLK